MKVYIEKGKAMGTVAAPPSKSMTHRLLICSGLAGGESYVHGIQASQDILATMDCLRALGAKCTLEGDTAKIQGVDIKNIKPSTVLNCRESGSTLRFFIPLCLLCNRKISLEGSQKLFSRPLGVYETICEQNGILFEKSENTLSVKGVIQSGNYKIQGNISSQFISGLLFALPLLKEDSTINIIPPVESLSYINLTLSALKEFGVSVVWNDERTLYIKGGQKYTPADVYSEGDYSNAAFFEAFNVLGGEVKTEGLNPDSLQGDKAYLKYFPMFLRGTPTINISDCPDLGPILFALAAAKSGGIFSGTRRLKIKESDRGAAMAQELEKFGVSVKVMEDTIIVYPTDFHKPSTVLSGHNDHRIVMALSVISSLTGGEIEGAQAVNKSMPEFFDRLKQLGLKVETDEENQ